MLLNGTERLYANEDCKEIIDTCNEVMDKDEAVIKEQKQLLKLREKEVVEVKKVCENENNLLTNELTQCKMEVDKAKNDAPSRLIWFTGGILLGLFTGVGIFAILL